MEETDSVDSEYLHMSRDIFKNRLKERFSNPLYPSRNSSSTVPMGAESENSCDVYNFDHPHRGLAVIINNETFKYAVNRVGSHHDERALKKSFGDLGFHVEVFRDLTAYQMLLVAQAAAELYGHRDADCFVFAILTHGEESEKNENDIKKHLLIDVNGDCIETGTMISRFNDENCPSLTGKPRLFFIQACRGVKVDEGVRVAVLGNGELVGVGATATTPMETEQGGSGVTIRPFIGYPDSLIMYGSPPGYLAWRRKKTGSWFIQELCKFLDSGNVGGISFACGLTSVCRQVAWQYKSDTGDPATDEKKGMPVIESQLLNDIYMTSHNKSS